MYLIKCVVKMAMFMNKIYQIGFPKFEWLYENEKYFSPAHLYCRRFSLYTINLTALAKFCHYRRKSAIQCTIFAFNKITDFSSITCDAARYSSSVTLPPPFTITGPILIAIWHITSDLQVNQVTSILNHVVAWDFQIWRWQD